MLLRSKLDRVYEDGLSNEIRETGDLLAALDDFRNWLTGEAA